MRSENITLLLFREVDNSFKNRDYNYYGTGRQKHGDI